MNSEKGFSLLEVVASFVILSIVLLSFLPFFINAKLMSDSNMERLVVINLAEATLERVKISKYDYIQKSTENFKPKYLSIGNKSGLQIYSFENCASTVNCNYYKININNKNYFIDIKASQNTQEAITNLISIHVTVKNHNNKINYSVEGYVSDAENSP